MRWPALLKAPSPSRLWTLAHTHERAVAGRTTGLIELGEEVTWEGRHFGFRQRFTSRISAFDRPLRFQDRMIRGAFKSFVHDHDFEPIDCSIEVSPACNP